MKIVWLCHKALVVSQRPFTAEARFRSKAIPWRTQCYWDTLPSTYCGVPLSVLFDQYPLLIPSFISFVLSFIHSIHSSIHPSIHHQCYIFCDLTASWNKAFCSFFVFLSSASFYPNLLGIEGSSCMVSHTVTHSLSLGLLWTSNRPSQRFLPAITLTRGKHRCPRRVSNSSNRAATDRVGTVIG
jgi:hypothetical protein